jgi:choline-sulfatase
MKRNAKQEGNRDERVRRDLLKAGIVGAASLCLPGLPQYPKRTVAADQLKIGKKQVVNMPRREPYNIVLLMDDQHRADALGCAGHPIVQTPNLDRLARTGTRFTNAFCTSPICAPARASLLTGLYPRETGQRSNAQALPNDAWTFAKALRKAGYRTAAMGKTHFLPYGSDPTGKDLYQGFEDRITSEGVLPGIRSWIDTLTPSERNAWDAAAKRTDFPAGESVAGYLGEPSPLPDDRLPERWVTEQAVAWLRQRARDRASFCLLVSLDRPHPPNLTPQGVAELYPPHRVPLAPHRDPSVIADQALRRRIQTMGWGSLTAAQIQKVMAGYYAGCTFVDQSFGLLLDALADLELEKRTAVFYLSDHGEMLGLHGAFSKYCFYEPAIRIPLIIRLPEGVPIQMLDPLVETLDLTPTILAAANIRPERPLRGQDLLPFVRGDPATGRWRDSILTERHPPYPAAYISEACRDTRFKLVRHGDGSLELYDLQSDPYELQNVERSRDYTDIRQRLLSRLEAFAAEHRTKAL